MVVPWSDKQAVGFLDERKAARGVRAEGSNQIPSWTKREIFSVLSVSSVIQSCLVLAMQDKEDNLVRIQSGDALMIVDMQNDFLPGGNLAVPAGDQALPAVNRCITLFNAHKLPVFATRDWHPLNHCSFTSYGGSWPPHCVAGTNGAAFPDKLKLQDHAIIVSKATRRDQDAYSGFQGTDMHERLQSLGIKRLFVGGLATDYCVLNTVMDALKLGYGVMLLTDAIHAVNLKPCDGEHAVAGMISTGAKGIRSEQLF